MIEWTARRIRQWLGAGPATTAGGAAVLPVDRTTVGLCFDHARGVGFEGVESADIALQKMLDTLGRLNLKATFFCPARMCETAPDQLEKIAAAGHELGCLGFADENPRELTDDALAQLVFSCRAAFERRGLRPCGYRYPHSDWDDRFNAMLPRQQFVYHAHHDHARHPYYAARGPDLVRIPVCTDDRGLRHRQATVDLTTSKHHRYLRKAIARKTFVAVAFHPAILAEEPERLDHWEEWVTGAVRAGAAVGPLCCALPDALRPVSPRGGAAATVGDTADRQRTTRPAGGGDHA